MDAKWKSIPLGIEPKIEILYVGVMFHLGFSSISGEGTLCILKYAQTHTHIYIYIYMYIHSIFSIYVITICTIAVYMFFEARENDFDFGFIRQDLSA